MSGAMGPMAGMGDAMIEVRDLVRERDGRRVLDHVSFRAEPGEIVGFLGPNGAGKTTTLRVLAGILPPHAGSLRVAGSESPLEDASARRRIGYVPEHVPAPTDAGARDYVEFVGRLRGLSRTEARREARQRLEDVDLAKLGNRSVRRLSKGERQRVGLAAGLIGDPDVLLLDEPTSGLDPAQLARVRGLLRAQAGRKTILLSSHLLAEVTHTCDRVIVLHHGRVVAERSPHGAGVGPETLEIRVRGVRAGLEKAIAAVSGVREVRVAERRGELFAEIDADRDVRAAVAEAVVGSGRGLLELRRRETSLEATFLTLVAEASPEIQEAP